MKEVTLTDDVLYILTLISLLPEKDKDVVIEVLLSQEEE